MAQLSDLLLYDSSPINLQEAFLPDVSKQHGPFLESKYPSRLSMEILPSIQEAATLAIASNCTELCLDPSLLFGSLESFHNCLMYPAVTDLYANNMLSPNEAKMADSLIIEKSQRGSPLLSGIIQNITSCLNDYCLASSDCEQNFMDTFETVGAFFYEYSSDGTARYITGARFDAARNTI